MPITISEIEETHNHTIYVDDDNTIGPWYGTIEHPYQHVQEAIDHALDGDTVFVYNGYYYEINLTCNTSISLIAEDRENTIIEGNYQDSMDSNFLVNITNVAISNFCFTNYTIVFGFPYIQPNTTGKISFTNNIITDTWFGLTIFSLSKDLEIEITYNEFHGGKDAFFGLMIFSYGDKANLSYNVITGFSFGIYSIGDMNIFRNHISKSDTYGLAATPNSLDEIKLNITQNSFIENNVHATFTNGIDLNYLKPNLSMFPQQVQIFLIRFRSDSIMDKLMIKFNSIKWNENYWDNKKMIGPKCILGTYYLYSEGKFPTLLSILLWINVDWHPAKEPYEIDL